MPARILLEVENLDVVYGGVEAVRATNFVLEERRIAALVGPSGCGKTTLLRAIAGFERPLRGSIRFSDSVIAGAGHWTPPEKRNIGMVFQDGALFPHLTVFDNVGYGLERGRAREDRVREVLALVDLELLSDRYPDQLSGGQQQRVALARALAPQPQLVLLDEPFASLDATLRGRVRSEVRAILEKAELSAILVTHDQEEALSFADLVAVMMRGAIVQVGGPEEIYHRPVSAEVARFLGDGHVVPCTVSSGRFKSEFGEATCELKDGDGFVFVRPEDLIIQRWSQSDGVSGTVIERRFFGHDVLDKVQLPSGEEVAVRSLSSTTLPVGSPVRLTLRERTYHVFSPQAERS